MERQELEEEKRKLEEVINNLEGIDKRYYEFLPDECSMTEENQAKQMNVGKTRIKNLKKKLQRKGVIDIKPIPNGKRNNPKHLITKTYPNILRRFLGFDLQQVSFSPLPINEEDYSRYELELEEYCFFPDVNWSLLQQYSSDDINEMDKLAKVQLYMDCGFLVLPAHYPIFGEETVRCSCSFSAACPHIGKHPVHKYGYLDQLNYFDRSSKYLAEFEENPNLNIAFKVSGYSVLDVDNRHGGDVALQRLIDEYELSMKAVLTVECSNGKHIYLDNKHLKNTAGEDGLDIRSEGGIVIAPGSTHKSGNVYRWDEIGELGSLPVEIFEADTTDERPSDDIERGTSKRSHLKVSKRLADIQLPIRLTPDYTIPDGERGLTLFKWASRERGKGANVETIFEILVSIRDNHCDEGSEPVTDNELERICQSVVSQYEPNRMKNENSSS